MIWKAALPSSRVVLLEHKRRRFDDENAGFIPRIDKLGFRSDTRSPSILFVSREANKLASRYYSRAFTNQTGSSIPEVYFDFANDFLYLGPEWVGPCQPFNQERILYVLGNELHPSDLSRVKNLAVWWDHEERGGNRTLNTYLHAILKYFDNVSHIALVHRIYRGLVHAMELANNTELKLLDGSIDSEVDLKVHGTYLPGTSRDFSDDLIAVDLNLQLNLLLDPDDGLKKRKKVPSIEFNMIVTPLGEAHLLEFANNPDWTRPWELEWVPGDRGGFYRKRMVLSSLLASTRCHLLNLIRTLHLPRAKTIDIYIYSPNRAVSCSTLPRSLI